AFADALIGLAKQDSRVVALTAAMPDGTGLSKFEKEIPQRYMDTGICESHLTGMAAGMCKAGMRPFAAIYSTFIQRAFDQVWQEVVLNGMPVIFCMDRAGYVGDDGPVHHGFMDIAFLRPLPSMVLMAPSDEAELNRALRFALSLDVPSAMLSRVLNSARPVLTLEDHALQNGFGTAVVEHAVMNNLPAAQITRLGMPDRLIAHASRKEQLAEVGLDAPGIARSVRDAARASPSVSVKVSVPSRERASV